MDGLKTMIENILPYYGIGVFILSIICFSLLFLEEIIISIFGECIYLEEIDMIITRRYTEHAHRNDNNENLDTNKVSYMLELQHPTRPEYRTSKSVSHRFYRDSSIGDIVKMHEIIYKYKDKYIKRVVDYSQHNISKYEKCSQNSKNSFNLFKNDILNKCEAYDNESGRKLLKIFPIFMIPLILLFVMVFIVNS